MQLSLGICHSGQSPAFKDKWHMLLFEILLVFYYIKHRGEKAVLTSYRILFCTDLVSDSKALSLKAVLIILLPKASEVKPFN